MPGSGCVQDPGLVDVTAGSCADTTIALQSALVHRAAIEQVKGMVMLTHQLDADSDGGDTTVRGVTAAEDAPFQIQALSSAGDVSVEASG